MNSDLSEYDGDMIFVWNHTRIWLCLFHHIWHHTIIQKDIKRSRLRSPTPLNLRGRDFELVYILTNFVLVHRRTRYISYWSRREPAIFFIFFAHLERFEPSASWAELKHLSFRLGGGGERTHTDMKRLYVCRMDVNIIQCDFIEIRRTRYMYTERLTDIYWALCTSVWFHNHVWRATRGEFIAERMF